MSGARDDLASLAVAEEFALLARVLGAAASPEAAEEAVTRAALTIVPGCDAAAISLVDRHGGVVTTATAVRRLTPAWAPQAPSARAVGGGRSPG